MALAAPTQVRIYNRALALLGSTARVANVDDGRPVTDTLNDLWPDAVRELLAEHPWNCCIARKVLNKSEDLPEFGTGFYYELPADCLRWLPWPNSSEHYVAASEEAGNRLLADGAATINIRYIRQVEDPTAWAPHMVTAMAHLLAWLAAEPITQSASVAAKMKEAWHGADGMGGALASAKEKDGLATGDRDRGNVEVRSRALSAARTPGYPDFYPPSYDWG